MEWLRAWTTGSGKTTDRGHGARSNQLHGSAMLFWGVGQGCLDLKAASVVEGGDSSGASVTHNSVGSSSGMQLPKH